MMSLTSLTVPGSPYPSLLHIIFLKLKAIMITIVHLYGTYIHALGVLKARNKNKVNQRKQVGRDEF